MLIEPMPLRDLPVFRRSCTTAFKEAIVGGKKSRNTSTSNVIARVSVTYAHQKKGTLQKMLGSLQEML